MITNNNAKATAEEILTIKNINEKKEALENLIFVSEENNPLLNEKIYQRFLKDYQLLIQQMHEFWKCMALAHNLSMGDTISYTLDYDSGMVTVISADKE